jgi:hypothetical protein
VTFIGGERRYPGWGNTHAELVLRPWRLGRKQISRRGDGGLAGEVSAGICGRGVTAVLLDETRQAAAWWPASCQERGRRLAVVLELGGDGTCRRFNGDRGVEQQGAVTSWASAMC